MKNERPSDMILRVFGSIIGILAVFLIGTLIFNVLRRPQDNIREDGKSNQELVN